MNLSDPIDIRGRHFANRSVLAPMVPNCAGQDGSVTDAYAQFYQARSRVGFVVLGATYVHPQGKGFERQLGIYDDTLIPGLTDLVQALQRTTRVGIQLSFKSAGRLPETFKRDEINTIREAFVQAAVRAQKCGFTAIELHACHDYWLNYFLSPHFNHRQDLYGGSLENRFHLLKEVVQSVRSELGETLLLGVRLSMDEFVADGLTLEETVQVGNWLEQLGVDYLSASGGIGQTHYRISPPMEIPRGSLLHLPRALKQAVSIPVIGVGRLDRPQIFQQTIADGSADMAAAARALIADPEYVVKVIAKRDQEIRPCVACNFCLLCLHRNEPVRCTVNPYLGQDHLILSPLAHPQKVIVVGGGPAGLSAAATAAARGARVKLFEKDKNVGGVVNLGKKPPFKNVLQDFIDYLEKMARAHHVDIQTGLTATADIIRKEAPDRIIIATGATSLWPRMNGLDTHGRVLSALEAFALEQTPPGKYLIVGGGTGGLELAEFLASEGVDITVIEMTDQTGSGLHATRQHLLLERIEAARVRLQKHTRLVAIEGKTVKVETLNGSKTLGPFDCIVFAIGYQSNTHLADEIKPDRRVTIIGDAVRPRSIVEAIREGFEAGLNL